MLDCSRVGSLDFNFLVEMKSFVWIFSIDFNLTLWIFSTKPPKSDSLFAGGVVATENDSPLGVRRPIRFPGGPFRLAFFFLGALGGSVHETHEKLDF